MIERKLYGHDQEGNEVYRYEITSEKLYAEVSEYGAALLKLIYPDRTGRPVDVVLGYDSLEGYYDNAACMGVVVAPNANRTANASFVINDVTYTLDHNEGRNNLHSHLEHGAHKRLWKLKGTTDNSVTLELYMSDGELGFPGNRIFNVTYSVEDNDTLRIQYEMYTDRETVFNPTNHSYFNLAGHGSGSILGQKLLLRSRYYTPVDEEKIPTGEIADVRFTPMDFREFKALGKDYNAASDQLGITNGYDHNFLIDSYDGQLRHFASLKNESNGLIMHGYTTQPGVQLYTGNYLGSDNGKDGAHYRGNAGVALETQFYPNAMNMTDVPKPLARAQQWTVYVTEYQFEIDN